MGDCTEPMQRLALPQRLGGETRANTTLAFLSGGTEAMHRGCRPSAAARCRQKRCQTISLPCRRALCTACKKGGQACQRATMSLDALEHVGCVAPAWTDVTPMAAV